MAFRTSPPPLVPYYGTLPHMLLWHPECFRHFRDLTLKKVCHVFPCPWEAYSRIGRSLERALAGFSS